MSLSRKAPEAQSRAWGESQRRAPRACDAAAPCSELSRATPEAGVTGGKLRHAELENLAQDTGECV